ncbi:MAG TPA: outer membrane beta-barrel protein [Alphaproteobacteria bacterium]|nr:outer membrane beta-barrel protein [Alphaproteobacteria bacterium]
MIFVPEAVHAAPELFNTRVAMDGSLNFRRSTTEQFNPIRGQSVLERPRPDFDPTPIPLGGFQLFPAISAGAYYNSNIYSSAVSTKDDVVTVLTPTLSAVSNWGKHAVAFTGSADFAKYAAQDSESYLGGFMQAEGRYDLLPKTWLAGNISYQRVTEPRSSPSVLSVAAEPTQYNLYNAGAEAYRGLGILRLKGNYDFSSYDYGTVTLVSGGVSNQNVRNRQTHALQIEAEYKISENLKPFVRAVQDWRDYSVNSLRSSTGHQIDAGARMDLGGLITAEAYIGFLGRNYHNFSGGSPRVVDFGGNALWNVTPLTSVQFEFSRSIEETTVGGATSPLAASAALSTGGSVRVAHELRRDVLLQMKFSFAKYDYARSFRRDDQYGLAAGSRYFINRNLFADVGYNFSARGSNAAGGNYSDHALMFRIGAHF